MKRIQILIAFTLCLLLQTCEPVFAGGRTVNTVAGIQSAIQAGVLVPGDTLWIHGGTYRMLLEPYLNGTPSQYIVIRSYPNEIAVFDNAGTGEANYVKGDYLEYRDLWFTNSNLNVTRSEAGLNAGDSKGFRAINCYLTNSGATGFNPYWGATDLLFYGNIITYYGRFNDPDHANGYGIYGQNNLPSRKKFEDNIVFRGFGIWLIHLSGSGAAHIDGFDVLGNTVFGHDLYEEKNPICLIGNFETGAGKASDDVFSGNKLFRANLWVGYNGDGATRFTHDNNYYYKGNISATNTDYLSNSGNTFTSNGDRVFVSANKWVDKYTRNRGYITVFNGSNLASVSVNFPAGMLAVGERYEVIDVQNYAGPAIASGTYSGASINVPMTSTAITQPTSIPENRQGNSMPRHTDPEFGCFLVLGTVGSGTPLSVMLTSFTADQTGKNVLLNWSTASELNNFGFWVERTSDSVFTVLPGSFQAGYGTTTVPHNYSFLDSTASGRVTYRLKQQDLSGIVHYPGSPVTVTLTGIERTNAAPSGYTLFQNYPNPFNSETHIYFSIASTAHTTLKLYDTLGRVIRILYEGVLNPGEYGYILSSDRLSTGVYIYRIQSGGFSAAKAMVVLK